MKRRIKSLLSMLVVGGVLLTSQVVAQASYINVSADSVRPVEVTTTAGTSLGVMYNEKTFVPLNVLRSLDTTCFANIVVDYEPSTKDVTISFNDGYNHNPYSKLEVKVVNSNSSVVISSWKVGSSTPETTTYNNQEILNIDGSLYVPLAIFRDYIGFDVMWNASNKSVTIPGTFTFTEDDVNQSVDELKNLISQALKDNPDVPLNISEDTLNNLLNSTSKEELEKAFEDLEKGLDVSEGVHKTARDVSNVIDKLTHGESILN